MRDSLHAVIVDDNPDDRTLVLRELRRAFPALHADEVTDQKSFGRVLDAKPADLVVTDFQLGWTDGLAIVRRVKARWPDCSIIMFTGTGSEEIAVQAMKAGLHDYVLKSPKHYARLPASARLALKMTQQKRQLKEAESRYSMLFATVPIGLYRATPDGRILEANPALVEMLQYPDTASLLAVKMGDLHLDTAAYEEWQRRLQRGEVVHQYPTRFRTFTGAECWIENSARANCGPDGALVYDGSVENITQRKQAEDERERLIAELQEVLLKVRTLSGLLPICAACKKIRDDNGYWNQIEEFIQSHSDAEFTHSFCPECMRTLYPELFRETVAER